jgi:uncharacterized membrane protein
MDLRRLLRHLLATRWSVARAFPRGALDGIERAIRDSEATHEGQIRFAVEAALDLGPLLAGVAARERALQVFSELRVWDTEHNNGVLIYLLLADHDVEIVADRGIHRHVGEGWEAICRAMEARLRQGELAAGVVEGIRAVGEHLRRHYPRRVPGPDELPDRPVIL